MATKTLTENVNQAIADFDGIKTAIVTKGVAVPNGTPTAQYGAKIGEIPTGGDYEDKTVALAMLSGNQEVLPTVGKDAMTKVTITKPSTLVATNIKKDVDIGGVIGTLAEPSGDIAITANAQYNVAQYATATVNVAVSTEEKTLALNMASGNQIVDKTADKDGMTKVTIEKPATMTAPNIKKDVNIGGVIGTLVEGIIPTGTKEITTNGLFNVREFENANVNVPIPPTPPPATDYSYLNIVQVEPPTTPNSGTYTTMPAVGNTQTFGIGVGGGVYFNGAIITKATILSNNLVDASNLLDNCDAVKDVKLNLPNVTIAPFMFNNCGSQKKLDLTSMTSVTNAAFLLSFNASLESVDIRTWASSKLTNYRDMFLAVPSTCKVYVGPLWTLTEAQVSFRGTFIRVGPVPTSGLLTVEDIT